MTALDLGAALDLLATGEIDVQGRMIDASNATLYCAVSGNGIEAACVYKPVAGERPLWDFPDGTLAAREVAAFAVSAATGWDLVPPTVLRDGPYGPGMVQLWIDTDETVDLGELARSDHPDLARMVVLDAVINNADRKLRTLLWQWRGDPLPEAARETLEELRADLDSTLGTALRTLLDRREVRATTRRVDRLLREGTYPLPSGDWPAVPWPPF